MMVDKYLENQINPLPLIEYDQTTTEIKRTFHLDLAYRKLKAPVSGEQK